MAACDQDSGGDDAIDFVMKNNSIIAITNIKVYDYDMSLGFMGETVGDAKYDSGTINIAPGATHNFTVSGLTKLGGFACFQIEVTSSEGTEALVTTNGYWYSADFTFEGD